MNIKKFFKRLGLSILGLFVFLTVTGMIMQCVEKKQKEKPKIEISKEPEKIELTQKQKDIIQEHYDLYNKLTTNAKTGEDLDKASKEVTKQLCEKYKMTTKEYEAMWDIYNFGFITEENK